MGKRLGRVRWFAANPKTVEGTGGFVGSVMVCAWALRVSGTVEDFSVRAGEGVETGQGREQEGTDAMAGRLGLQMARFGMAAGLAGLLEAFSVQNDNLTLPLYMWAMLVLLDVVRGL